MGSSITKLLRLRRNKDNNETSSNSHTYQDSLIDTLTDDCLIKIFSYLDFKDKLSVERVCKRWLCVSQLGWPEVTDMPEVTWLRMGLPYAQFTGKEMELIFLRCGRFLKRLSITASSSGGHYLRLVEENCPNLKELLIAFDAGVCRSTTPIYLNTLSSLFGKLRLNELRVHFSHSNTVDHYFFENIDGGALECLCLMGTVLGDGTHLRANVCRFRNLHRLNLTHLIIEEESLQGFPELINLVELDLSHSDLPIKFIEEIQNFRKLQSLFLMSGPRGIRDHHISAIVANCDLQVLAVDGCAGLTDYCFKDVARLKNLNYLRMNDLPNVTNCAIEAMFRVRSLHCDYCPQINNNGLRELIKNSSNLIELSVIGTADMSTFLQSASEAIEYRKKALAVITGQGDWPVPKNLSPLLVFY